MDELIDEILNRKGVQLIIDGNKLYTENSVKDVLKEVLLRLPISGKFIGCRDCLRPEKCAMNGCAKNGSENSYQ